MKARILCEAPTALVVDLFHDVCAYAIESASALLAAYVQDFAKGTVFVCVVDPGVGTAQRKPGALFVDDRWFVGPLNGLFEHVIRQAVEPVQAYEITHIPKHVSETFHGRDIFAPTAAKLVAGDLSCLTQINVNDIRQATFEDDVKAVIYIDSFGNMMTGIRAKTVSDTETLEVLGHKLAKHRTFSEAKRGELFVYENSVGLMEISANLGNAKETLNISAFPKVKMIQV